MKHPKVKYPNELPCGFKIGIPPFQTGRSKVLRDHYKTCSHEYCAGRRAEWLTIVKQFQSGR